MNLSAAELAALDDGHVRIGFFFRLASTPVIRLWLAVGKIETTQPDALDAAGAVYKGMGELRNIPEFNQLINGQAERVEFTLSGVSGDVLAAAAADINSVKDKEVSIGFALMDGDWQLIGPVKWVRTFYSDVPSINQGATEDAIVRPLALSCGSLMTARRRPRLGLYSDAEQQREHPGDRIFERVPKYTSEIRKPWPAAA